MVFNSRVSKQGLHPVITVACYILCPPGTINRQILLLEAALSQEMEIIMPSRHWVSATVWRRSRYVGGGGRRTRTFLWAQARQLHLGKKRMLGDADLA